MIGNIIKENLFNSNRNSTNNIMLSPYLNLVIFGNFIFIYNENYLVNNIV